MIKLFYWIFQNTPQSAEGRRCGTHFTERRKFLINILQTCVIIPEKHIIKDQRIQKNKKKTTTKLPRRSRQIKFNSLKNKFTFVSWRYALCVCLMKSSSVDLRRSLRWVNFFSSKKKKTITKLISSYTQVSDVFRCRSTGSTNKRVITKIIINFILNALNLLFFLSRAVSAPPSRGLGRCEERERKKIELFGCLLCFVVNNTNMFVFCCSFVIIIIIILHNGFRAASENKKANFHLI